MPKTKIDWATHSINPVRGLCPNTECPCFDACYARRHYQRFHSFKDGTINPTWDYKIRLDDDAFLTNFPAGARVFVGSTMELFGPWVPSEWLRGIFAFAERQPYATFIFLTKRPERLKEFSPFPANVWVGASVLDGETLSAAYCGLGLVKASVKFLSYEPLRQPVVMTAPYLTDAGIGWVIIGQQTPASKKTEPSPDWIATIIKTADQLGIPVFLKNNLQNIAPN